MKSLALTNKGIEDIAALEIREILGCKTEVRSEVVLFDVADVNDLYKLAYKAQSLTRVILLFSDFKITELSDIGKNIVPIGKEHFAKPTILQGHRSGEHSFNSKDISPEIVKNVPLEFAYKDFKSMLFYILVGNNFYLGKDIAGFDLSKREFKIFPNSFSIKGTLAYSLLRLADFSVEKAFLDPICRDGTIVMEAALFAVQQSPHQYGKRSFLDQEFDLSEFDSRIKTKTAIHASDPAFPNISAAKKNAKIAGVNKEISFKRCAIDDLDLSFKKESIDCVVTSAKSLNEKFFLRIAYILMTKGRIAVLIQKDTGILGHAEKAGLRLISSRKVFMGKGEYSVFLFGKNT